MEGSIKDAGSRRTEARLGEGLGRSGIQRCRILFGNWLRNRLGERYLIPVAPGLFAVLFFNNHSFRELSRLARFVAAIFFKKPGIIFFAVLVFVYPAGKVGAVPICDNDYGYAWYSTESCRADWDLYGYNLVGLPFPGPVCGGFNEGDNIEWIYYALENQYAFLDDTLYRITGGCYLLGPVCYPHWHGFRYYYCLGVPGREIIYISGNPAAYIDSAEYGDITALAAPDGGNERENYPAGLRKIPRKIYPGSELFSETETVPEPSTFILFGLAALQLLRLKKNRQGKEAGI